MTVYDFLPVKILVGVFSELFMLGEYMKFCHEDFGGIKSAVVGGLLVVPCLVSVVAKNAVNIVELKQGVLRIIDCDIRDKAKKS